MKKSRTNRLEIPPERLEELCTRLQRNCEIKPNGCWEWKLARNPAGYGNTTCGDLRGPAHKFSYAAFVGVVPAGMVVRHKCDNPPCINPEHLEVGTQWENAMDCVRRGRAKFLKKQEYCNRGLHKMEGENIAWNNVSVLATGDKYWGRQCRACKIETERKRQRRKKAAALRASNKGEEK